MMNKSIYSIFLLVMAVSFSGQAFASIDVYEFDNEEKRADFVALTKELRCPKCQNQDIADSNAPIAKDMRTEVHRMLVEGQDKDSIVAFMIERFGEFVTYKPKKTTETYLLWYGPWVFVFLGVIIIISLVKLNAKGSPKPNNASEEVKNILAKYEDKK